MPDPHLDAFSSGQQGYLPDINYDAAQQAYYRAGQIRRETWAMQIADANSKRWSPPPPSAPIVLYPLQTYRPPTTPLPRPSVIPACAITPSRTANSTPSSSPTNGPLTSEEQESLRGFFTIAAVAWTIALLFLFALAKWTDQQQQLPTQVTVSIPTNGRPTAPVPAESFPVSAQSPTDTASEAIQSSGLQISETSNSDDGLDKQGAVVASWPTADVTGSYYDFEGTTESSDPPASASRKDDPLPEPYKPPVRSRPQPSASSLQSSRPGASFSLASPPPPAAAGLAARLAEADTVVEIAGVHHQGRRPCDGKLLFTDHVFQLECQSGSFAVERSDIEGLDNNGVRLATGQKYHFDIDGYSKAEVHGLFSAWLVR